jgi:hypothetical protein
MLHCHPQTIRSVAQGPWLPAPHFGAGVHHCPPVALQRQHLEQWRWGARRREEARWGAMGRDVLGGDGDEMWRQQHWEIWDLTWFSRSRSWDRLQIEILTNKKGIQRIWSNSDGWPKPTITQKQTLNRCTSMNGLDIHENNLAKSALLLTLLFLANCSNYVLAWNVFKVFPAESAQSTLTTFQFCFAVSLIRWHRQMASLSCPVGAPRYFLM